MLLAWGICIRNLSIIMGLIKHRQKMKTSISLLILIAILTVSPRVNSQFVWPDGAKSAVCLTYDDGLDCHLDVAVPQLDEFSFKGSFYCTGNSPSLYKRMDEWRQIVLSGHELGNHTLFHPCDQSRHDFVRDEFDLNTYSLGRLYQELETANTLLKAVDGMEKRTYAYTCGNFIASSGIDFSDSIRHMFTSARGGNPVIPDDMAGFNIYKTPSWGVSDPSTKELIAYVEQAREKGTIAIFMFHSVGGGYLNVGAREHRELLQYLKDNSMDYYCATFMEVMDYLSQQSGK